MADLSQLEDLLDQGREPTFVTPTSELPGWSPSRGPSASPPLDVSAVRASSVNAAPLHALSSWLRLRVLWFPDCCVRWLGTMSRGTWRVDASSTSDANPHRSTHIRLPSVPCFTTPSSPTSSILATLCSHQRRLQLAALHCVVVAAARRRAVAPRVLAAPMRAAPTLRQAPLAGTGPDLVQRLRVVLTALAVPVPAPAAALLLLLVRPAPRRARRADERRAPTSLAMAPRMALVAGRSLAGSRLLASSPSPR